MAMRTFSNVLLMLDSREILELEGLRRSFSCPLGMGMTCASRKGAGTWPVAIIVLKSCVMWWVRDGPP